MPLDTCAQPKSPSYDRTEKNSGGETERREPPMPRGVARVPTRHLFNWEPTWPPLHSTTPSAPPHPRENARQLARASAFSPCDLDIFLPHPPFDDGAHAAFRRRWTRLVAIHVTEGREGDDTRTGGSFLVHVRGFWKRRNFEFMRIVYANTSTLVLLKELCRNQVYCLS